MADTRFVRPYAALERHRAEMALASRQRRRRVGLSLLGVLTAAALAWWLIPPLTVLFAGIGALIVFFSSITGSSSVPADQMSGAEGEVRVLRKLELLPDDHIIFNQVQVPDPSLPNGRRELDFVVIGPGAVHVIEVKNTRGLIYVRPDQQQWPLAHKAGCGGRPGWNAMDNPIGQVRAQVQALDRWLLEHGQTAPIRPILCFARPDVALSDRELAELPILTAEELLPHLIEQQEGLSVSSSSALLELLARQLRSRLALAA